MLMEINPDILLLTGDAVDMGDAWENLGTWLRSLDIPSAHKFAVLGNWEYSVGFDPEELRRLYAAHGFTLLINESRDLFFSGGTIRITGLDDGRYGEPDFRVINPNLGYPEIVMIHEPLLADEIAEEGVSGKILISGHTHGGQMAFGGRPIYFPPSWGNYIAGDFHVAGNHLYVSKGIGMSTLNIRFGARPDIIVLHIDPVIVSPNE